MNEGTQRILIVCLTLIGLLLVAGLWHSCEQQRDRRARCVEAGHSIAECKEAFGNGG